MVALRPAVLMHKQAETKGCPVLLFVLWISKPMILEKKAIFLTTKDKNVWRRGNDYFFVFDLKTCASLPPNNGFIMIICFQWPEGCLFIKWLYCKFESYPSEISICDKILPGTNKSSNWQYFIYKLTSSVALEMIHIFQDRSYHILIKCHTVH